MNESFYTRDQMPQISQDQITTLIDTGIGKLVKVVPTKLRATQKNFDYTKIASIKSNPSDKPIVVSNDLYVCDGHHRWLAHDWNNPISACVIDLPWNDCLKFLTVVASTH
jgi:hypothetical protein